MRFVLDKVALGQVFLPALLFTPVSIIPPMLRTHPHLHVDVARRKSGRSLGTLLKSNAVRAVGGRRIDKYYYLVIKGLVYESLHTLRV